MQKFMMSFVVLFWTGQLFAQSQKAEQPKPLRVGGTYEVTSIKESKEGFAVEFTAMKKTGKFDKLYLDSDHVHFSVKQGEKLRLSAEILSAHGSAAEVSQVLLFLPSEEGQTPIWLLSKKNTDDLNASKFIEMHAPQADFRVF